MKAIDNSKKTLKLSMPKYEIKRIEEMSGNEVIKQHLRTVRSTI